MTTQRQQLRPSDLEGKSNVRVLITGIIMGKRPVKVCYDGPHSRASREFVIKDEARLVSFLDAKGIEYARYHTGTGWRVSTGGWVHNADEWALGNA